MRYGAADARAHTAVDRISFDIAAGEVVGLMGESGSGKSSIALALLGLLPAETAEVSGSVLFRGEELTGMREGTLEEIRGAAISLVFQEPGISLSPMMRAGDQIAEVIHAHRRWNWRRCRVEAEEMLARVGLTPTARIFAAYPHQLSGGQRQRVVLAQALACDPALLIADEPTASLDARSQADFIALLRSLKEQARISILLISHKPEIQASLADRLLVMKDGQIVEEGNFDELYRNPSDAYTRLMLRRSKSARNSRFAGEPVFAEEQFAR
ncbi:MAG: ATP-binding cassette domain-containing protein [Candidatus Acidiferrales bacterium]